jgi:hypothetical protein
MKEDNIMKKTTISTQTTAGSDGGLPVLELDQIGQLEVLVAAL